MHRERVKTNDQQFHSDNICGSWHTQKDLINAYLRTTRAGQKMNLPLYVNMILAL